MSTYRDYLWFKEEPFSWWEGNGYLVSLIRDATTHGVLESLNAFGGRRRGTGYLGFSSKALEFEHLELVGRPMASCAQIVGVADIGDGWVLLIQQNSEYLGISDDLYRPVIESHEVVSHSSNINAVSRFVWWRDGTCQISFEPLLPDWDLDAAMASPTEGSPTVLQLIPEVGGIEREPEEPRTEFFHCEGAFALAERLTGVAVTRQMLESADFTVAIVPTVPNSECEVEHELPPRVPLLGEEATWEEVVRLYRSSAESTVHGTMMLSDSGSGTDEHHDAEFWHRPFGGSRQVDRDGLLAVSNSHGQWYRGPYAPDTWPDRLIEVHRRWPTPFAELLPSSTPGVSTIVAGREAWEFVLPPEWPGGSPVAVALDARNGVVLRVETTSRTEELTAVVLDEQFDDGLFELPG